MEILGSGSTQTDAALGVRGDVVVPDNRDALPAFRWLDDFDHTTKMVGNPTGVNINFYQNRPPRPKTPATHPPSPAPAAPSANSSPPKAPASSAAGDEMAGAADHRSIAARVTFIKKPRKSGPRNTLTLWVEICLRGLSNGDLQGLKLYLLSFASRMPRNYSGS